MDVLYYHQHFSTPDGATGTRSYYMASRLLQRGHRVTLVCGSYRAGCTGLRGEFVKGVRKGVVDGIDIIEFELPYSNRDDVFKRSVTFFRFAVRSLVVAMTNRYDLIFCTSTPLTAGIPGIFARLLRRKRFVFEVRDLWPEAPRAMQVITNPFALKLMDWLEWCTYHAAHGVIGLSPGIVDGIKRRGIKDGRTAMIPNGCDLEIFRAHRQVASPDEGVKNDFIAVYAGTHGMANGLHAVLDAAAELRKRNRTDIQLLFVGDGSTKDELKSRAVNEHLENCHFLDPMPKLDVARFLSRADLGLMILANVPAFYYGTSPNKFFDYIASGLPVLCNYPGWMAELVRQFGCGVAVPPDNPIAFADAMEYLSDNRDLVGKMGRTARRLAEDRFARKQLADQWVEFLEKVYRA